MTKQQRKSETKHQTNNVETKLQSRQETYNKKEQEKTGNFSDCEYLDDKYPDDKKYRLFSLF